MADIHKLTFNGPQGRNAGSLWTHAVWGIAEHGGGEKAASSLSLTDFKSFSHIG